MHVSPCSRHNDMIARCHSSEGVCGVEVQWGWSGSRPGPRSRPQGETKASQKLFVLEEDRERSICMCGYDMHSATAAGTEQGLRRDSVLQQEEDVWKCI